MPDNTSQQGSRKRRLWKIILLNVIVVIVGIHLVAYQRESARWAGHPYPEAKKALIKANFGLLYGRFLTSIPGINEKSLIMQPIKSMTNHYVEEAKRHIPDTDGEKEMYWYLFKLGYIKKNSGFVLNDNDAYSHEEIRAILDEMWLVLEGIGTKEIKDSEFVDMRYAALHNMAYMYLLNQIFYHIDLKAWDFDYPALWRNELIAERNQRLFLYMINMEKLYKEGYPEIVRRVKRNIQESTGVENYRYHLASGRILTNQIATGKYKDNPDFCDPGKNIYLEYYLNSRSYLVRLAKDPKSDQLTKEHIMNNILNKKQDEYLAQACKNINISQDDN